MCGFFLVVAEVPTVPTRGIWRLTKVRPRVGGGHSFVVLVVGSFTSAETSMLAVPTRVRPATDGEAEPALLGHCVSS